MKKARPGDKIPMRTEDVTASFKLLKMGLRVTDLALGWDQFRTKYDRILETSKSVFNFESLDMEMVEKDLDRLGKLHTILNKNQWICDTVDLANKEISKGKKRFIVEDASSSSMDVDTGVYPYTSSFNTITGQVCLGLGVPEESIETTIGVMSAVSCIQRDYLQRINRFPT
jgi:adenylosuccinate synthase